MQDSNWLFGPESAGMISACRDILPEPPAIGIPFAAVKSKLFIAMTSRTGSTLLAQQLTRYGLGVQEYFNRAHIRRVAEREGLRDYGELCAHYAATKAPNGAFGVKGPLPMMMPLFLAGEWPAAIQQWKFVYTTRTNVVLQAISLVIAEKSGAWDSRAKANYKVKDSDYSAADIVFQMRSIYQGMSWLEFFFASYGIQPLRLTFEQIVADPRKIADQVAEYCGLDEEISELEATQPLESQTTDRNLEWEWRFRHDTPEFSL
jgi:LPS sulfotransferase NodH